jgi:type IV pilus assembly protein PilV
MNIHHRAKNQQTGSVILEALIAILIFSIGILALVGMQATAINSVSDAKYRSTAGFLANQIVGTIWATRLNTTIVSASGVVAAIPDMTFACARPCGAANGNAYTQAWVASGVAANLPRGTASIAIINFPAANASMVTVTIDWQPPKDAVSHVHAVSTFIN